MCDVCRALSAVRCGWLLALSCGGCAACLAPAGQLDHRLSHLVTQLRCAVCRSRLLCWLSDNTRQRCVGVGETPLRLAEANPSTLCC
jgi:hypothetical protein